MSTQDYKILVYSEDGNILQELLGKARETGAEVTAAFMGATDPKGADYGTWGAATLYTVVDPSLNAFNPETYSDALAGIISETHPDLVMVGATKQGLELSARVAERLEMSCASWCVDFELDTESQQFLVQCMIYSGVGVNRYRLGTRPAMVTVAGGVFLAAEQAGKDAEVIPVSVEIQTPKMMVLEQKGKMAAGRRLQDAPVIVDVGQGFKAREDVAMADELAELLSGQVSCSRPISSERDWFPEWIGLSGAQLSPELCFTVGTSGAIQHMIGIRDSKIIVSVNNDEYAGSHYQADYGVVADLYEFLPALIEVIRKRSIRLK
jgi:electron transfer flavoprotein alpha subunit